MPMTWDEACEAASGPDGPFPLVEADVLGTPTLVFQTAPGTLKDLFALARMRGDADYIVYEDETYTFADVMAQADAIGALLVERYGVQKGDRIAIAMRNYPEWISSYIAVTSIGAIAVLLNAWWTQDELRYGLEHSGAAVLIADRERPRGGGAEAGPGPLPRGVPKTGRGGRPGSGRARGLADRGGRRPRGRPDRDRGALGRGRRARRGPPPRRVAVGRDSRDSAGALSLTLTLN